MFKIILYCVRYIFLSPIALRILGLVRASNLVVLYAHPKLLAQGIEVWHFIQHIKRHALPFQSVLLQTIRPNPGHLPSMVVVK